MGVLNNFHEGGGSGLFPPTGSVIVIKDSKFGTFKYASGKTANAYIMTYDWAGEDGNTEEVSQNYTIGGQAQPSADGKTVTGVDGLNSNCQFAKFHNYLVEGGIDPDLYDAAFAKDDITKLVGLKIEVQQVETGEKDEKGRPYTKTYPKKVLGMDGDAEPVTSDDAIAEFILENLGSKASVMAKLAKQFGKDAVKLVTDVKWLEEHSLAIDGKDIVLK